MQISKNPTLKPLQQELPLFSPVYPQEYRQIFNNLKILMQKQQFSQETNRVAEELIPFLESNYNCWYAKKKCLQNGTTNVQHENQYSTKVLMGKIKNFQIWQYRRFIIDLTKQYQKEYKLIDNVLAIEGRNYHAWTHRTWILNHVLNFEQQIIINNQYIEKDISNNSAWSYRFYLIKLYAKSNPKILQQELSQQIKQAQEKPNNQSLWNYIRGFYPSIKIKGFNSHKTIFTWHQATSLRQICENIVSKENHKSIQALITLLHIYSHTGQYQYAKNLVQLIIELDSQRVKYWKWVQQSLQCSA